MAEEKGRTRNPAPAATVREAEAPATDLPTGAVSLEAAVAQAVAPTIPVGGHIASDMLPTGFFGSVLGDANAADDAKEIAPTFGDVLKSIGLAVAESQKALDDSLVTTAQKLSETTIKVVTDVVQVLDEDGRPDPTASEIITEEMSLVNFVPPTPHMWNHVAVSMDMSVGEITSESGFTFKQKQTNVNVGGGWFSVFGWFAGGSASHSSTEMNVKSETENKWATGSVRMDAELGSRPSDKLPVGAEIATGPRITFSQGAVKEEKRTGFLRRSMELTVEVRKDTGEPNPNKVLEVDVAPFSFSFVNDAASSPKLTGSTTNTAGVIKVLLTRDVPVNNPLTPTKGTVRVKLGQIRKQFEVTL